MPVLLSFQGSFPDFVWEVLVNKELAIGKDKLTEWIEKTHFNVCNVNDALILANYGEVLQYIQESDYYSNRALASWSQKDTADPWLIAAAKAKGYTIVTFETPSGGLNANTPNNNPKIPDVAQKFGVKTVNLYEMIRALHITI